MTPACVRDCCAHVAVALCLLAAVTAHADTAPLGNHVVRSSRVPLVAGKTGKAVALSFRRPGGSIIGHGMTDALPLCAKDDIRREEIYGAGPSSAFLDILFYSPDDPAQLRQRQSYHGAKAPYVESALTNPYAEPSIIQHFARSIALRCLPTRFHVVFATGRAYAEYREGARAWDEPPAE